jgi:TRIAP1/MDM35 family protein
MESIGKNCTELKKQYDDCFNKWYSEKFLKGDLSEQPCVELFQEYKACVFVIYFSLIKIAIKEKNLDKVLNLDKKK